MSLSYEPLWQMLNDRNISKMEFAKMIGMSNATLAKLGKNEPITLTIIDKICNCLYCQIEDVVKHVHDLKIVQANFRVKVGMIVLAEDRDDKIYIDGGPFFRFNKRPHIVLEAENGVGETDPEIIAKTPYEDLMYTIAPIYTSHTSNTSILNVPFEGVSIDDKITNGYVAFGRLVTVCSGIFEKQIGVMPESYMQKFDKILQSLDVAFSDDEY